MLSIVVSLNRLQPCSEALFGNSIGAVVVFLRRHVVCCELELEMATLQALVGMLSIVAWLHRLQCCGEIVFGKVIGAVVFFQGSYVVCYELGLHMASIQFIAWCQLSRRDIYFSMLC